LAVIPPNRKIPGNPAGEINQMIMNTLNAVEMEEVEGGNALLVGWAIVAYRDTLNKIEQNPQSYTWLMDWYYQK